MKSTIVVMGPPAGGKGTLCKDIQTQFNLDIIPPGEIYRRIREEDSEIGRLVKFALQDGGYCPSDLTNRIMWEESEKLGEDRKLFIFDGYPRTQEQFDFLFEKWNVGLWLWITAPYERLLASSVNRRICKGCGFTFRADIPIKEPCCPAGAFYSEDQWVTRFDDGEAFYEKRYRTYMESTKDLIVQAQARTEYREFQVLDRPEAIGEVLACVGSVVASVS